MQNNPPLYAQIIGEGPPLLILHGLFGSSDNWQSLSRRFSDSHKAFALDLRNHGHSFHAPGMSYPALAEDVQSFITFHKLSQVALLGHSLGGKVAMQVAASYPNPISKLIIVDIAPKAYGRHHDAILDALLALPLAECHTRSDANSILSKDIEDPVLRGFLLKNLSTSPEGLSWRINLRAIADDYDAIAAAPDFNATTAFKKRVLVISGANSDYIKPSDDNLFQRYFPNFIKVQIQDAGHWVHAEAAESFYNVCRDFLHSPST